MRVRLPNLVPFVRSRLLTWRAAVIFALLLIAVGAGLYIGLLADLPPATSATQRLVRPTTTIVDRNGRVLYEVLDPETGKQLPLPLNAIPEACIQATLATEDSRFYLHPGFDPIAIARAAWQNARGRTVVSGGSTLTQQLARNLLLPPGERFEQSLRRKIREAWLAFQLERTFSKDELLALYLNQTYFGNFAFGIEAAAQVFFAKPAEQLSRSECALLIGLIQYPSGYNPLLNPTAAKQRQLTVLRLMREAGYLSAADAEQIAAEPLRYRSQLFDIRAPHFVMMVQDLVVQRIGVERLRAGGLRIVTTLDLDLQRQAERAVRYRIDLLNCRLPGLCDATTDPNRRVDNAAAVILDAQTGDILSLVGSPNYFDAQIRGNVNAALALRQPGSAIKPFTYAAALDPLWMEPRGLSPMTPATILPDIAVTFYVRDEQGGNVPYQPVNYNRRFHGPVSVRTALASSYNIPAVRVLDAIGVETLQQIAAEAGITTFTRDAGLALTLGGGEVRLLDLTTAYGIFLDGRRLDTRALLDIQTQAADGSWQSLLGISPVLPGQIPPRTNARGAQVISPQAAYLITDILADPIARQPAFGAGSVLELPFPAAVKTGTTTDWRDNWTLGYTTRRIVGVWVGNADNTPMLDVSGIDGAGPIWQDLMRLAHPVPPPPFVRPNGIIEVDICVPSGLLPSPSCRRIHAERFIAGTEPRQVDDQFQTFVIDLATGARAGATTPPERRVERTYWVLPPIYHDWMVAQGLPMPPLPAPPDAAAHTATGGHDEERAGPLILTAPTSNTAYAIHPGVPRERQRVQVAGYAAGGATWATLRLVKDGLVLAQADNAARLSTWWVFEPGFHHFWLEGEATPDGPTVRTQAALVEVTAFGDTTLTEQTIAAAPADP